jgi:hypothetical protein
LLTVADRANAGTAKSLRSPLGIVAAAPTHRSISHPD